MTDSTEHTTTGSDGEHRVTFDFIVDNEGTPVNVHVIENYPLYDVTLDETATVQMEQDHHSNWYLTQGKLSDKLVQLIGKRIAHEVTGI